MKGAAKNMANNFFITGTDTGVGKTVFTAFLLWNLRRHGLEALAMKPLCSGGREDAVVLNRFQKGTVPLDRMNPFYFGLPLSPLVAARSEGRKVELQSVCDAVKGVEKQCAWLLIEGAGGLLSPLGEGFAFIDLIKQYPSEVIVVAKNRLGVINHLLLNETVLRQNGVVNAKFVLMDGALEEENCGVETSNLELAGELLGGDRILAMPNMGKNPCKTDVFKKYAIFFEKTVAPFLGFDRLISVARRKSVTKSVSKQ